MLKETKIHRVSLMRNRGYSLRESRKERPQATRARWDRGCSRAEKDPLQ